MKVIRSAPPLPPSRLPVLAVLLWLLAALGTTATAAAATAEINRKGEATRGAVFTVGPEPQSRSLGRYLEV